MQIQALSLVATLRESTDLNELAGGSPADWVTSEAELAAVLCGQFPRIYTDGLSNPRRVP